ncbi:MAG: hypothetical protein ABSA83_16520 [Verrucomicrobiota bacterium]|jgi:hypothetical protein
MKNSPNPGSSDSPHGFDSLVRFWACFFLCLIALGIISGLMLGGLFLLMGYRMF